jgi:serine/threonine protein phosphatase 1
MRTLAIGDIHGCLRALELLLDVVQPHPADLVVTLGDYIDRGPDSQGVLERLIDLRRQCQVVALRGNHDIMMLDARANLAVFEDWLASGGKQTLQSYGLAPNWAAFADGIPQTHWRFLEECRPYHEIPTHFFVHANAYPDIPLAEQPDHMLFWERLNPEQMRPHESGKIMVCGHTSQRSGLPLNFGFAVCIDTWAYGNGWLTCLDVGSGQYWQINQQGKRDYRTDWLADDF